MIQFKRKKGKYCIVACDKAIKNELPVDLLLQYPHQIEGDMGAIDVPFSLGDTVLAFESAAHKRSFAGIVKEVEIQGFSVWENQLCCSYLISGGRLVIAPISSIHRVGFRGVPKTPEQAVKKLFADAQCELQNYPENPPLWKVQIDRSLFGIGYTKEEAWQSLWEKVKKSVSFKINFQSVKTEDNE